MKHRNLKSLAVTLVFGLGLIPGMAGALDMPLPLPEYPGVNAPGAPSGNAPGFHPQCSEYPKAKIACQKAAAYCQSALEDWDDAQGLTKSNLLHCAFLSKKCSQHLNGDQSSAEDFSVEPSERKGR